MYFQVYSIRSRLIRGNKAFTERYAKSPKGMIEVPVTCPALPEIYYSRRANLQVGRNAFDNERATNIN